MALVVKRWRRYGQERLYVNDVDDDDGVRRASLGYYDCSEGRLHVADRHKDRTYEVIEALRPFLGDTVPPSLRPELGESPLAEENDLSRNRAGEAVAARAAELRPKGWQGIAARVLRLPTAATSWEVGAKGERIVGKRLDRLTRAGNGWHVLSSIVKRSGADIDHIVIGPPGVFTVNTKHHRDARIWVGEKALRVNNVDKQYLRNSRNEARSASRVLGSAVGVAVFVTPVLAFVGAASINERGSRGDVLITRGEEIDRVLRRLPAIHSPEECARIFTAARRAEIWLA